MLAKRTSKNQVTIPKEVIDHFRGVEYFNVTTKKGKIILSPLQILQSKDKLLEVRKKIKKLGITQKEVNEAIRWARRVS